MKKVSSKVKAGKINTSHSDLIGKVPYYLNWEEFVKQIIYGLGQTQHSPQFLKDFEKAIITLEKLLYTAKNERLVAMLMKTGLNNVLLSTLFNVVNNIVQHCYT